MKAREWYLEKWEQTYKNKVKEMYWSAYLLAFASKKELDRSINDQLKKQEEVSKAAKDANDKLGRANTLIVDADQMAAKQPFFIIPKTGPRMFMRSGSNQPLNFPSSE